MAAWTTQTSPDVIATGTTNGVRCVGCGYDLTGLAADGVCPECGTAVRISFASDPLVHAPAAYVRRLARGASLVTRVLSLAWLGLGIWVVVVALSLIGSFGLGLVRPDALVTGLVMFQSVAALACFFAVLRGWLLLASRNSAWLEDRDGPRSRTYIVPSLAMVPVTLLLHDRAEAVFVAIAPPWLQPSEAVLSILLASSGFAFHAWVSMLYLEWIGEQAGSRVLAERAGRNARACVLWATSGVLLAGLGPIIALVKYSNTMKTAREVLGEIDSRIAAREEARAVGSAV